jgi:hypothetical protein
MAACMTLNTILRGAQERARTSRVNAIAFISGMTMVCVGIVEARRWYNV